MCPFKPKHPCSSPGCPELTSGRFCHKHEELDKRKSREYDKQRDQTEERRWIHSIRWRKLSDLHKAKFPLCAECLKQSRDTPVYLTDHIIPHEGNAQRFWDWDNLQSLCNICHEEKHKGERFKRRGQ